MADILANVTAEWSRSHRAGPVVLTAALTLPALVMAVLWEWSLDHAVAVAVIALVYGALVLAAGVVVQAHAELRKHWADRLPAAIDAALRRRFSPYGRRYRRFLTEIHRDAGLRGPVGRLRIEDVFVPPRLTGDGATGTVWEHLRRTGREALSLVGEPGAGKTTLLKYMALTMARNRRAGWPVGAPRHKTPILLCLRDQAAAIVAGPEPSLAELARRSAVPAGGPEPPHWFDQQLDNGRCVILLDGLDEVPADAGRDLIAAWLWRQVAAYPRCRFVLTGTGPDGAARAVRLEPFTDEEALEFAGRWYRAVTGARGGEAERQAATLVAKAPYRNPLLLTMAANVAWFGGTDPSPDREVLYGELCAALLRPAEGEPATGGLGRSTEEAVRALAVAMSDREVGEIPAVEAADLVAPRLAEIRPQLDPEEFLDSVARGGGLLLERPGGTITFAHLSIQEYLAGRTS